MKNKKVRGFIFPLVLVITIFLIVVVNSVNTLSISTSKSVSNDQGKNKAYYIAYAGAEMLLSSLYDKRDDMDGYSIIEVTGVENHDYGFNHPKKNIIDEQNVPIKTKDGKLIGYVDMNGELTDESDSDGNEKSKILHYKVVIKGKIDKDSKKPSDSHIITVYVYSKNFKAPKIYEGIR